MSTGELAPLPADLRRFFGGAAPLAAGERVVVAFSGGTDSLALLWGLRQLAGIEVVAAHLDHAGDPGSAGRAAAAARLAGELGLACRVERAEEPARTGESREAAGRRLRYAYLERVRRESGARWIATAHHLDDQAETLLLRLRFGSGLEGLAGIQPVRGAVARPLLSWTRQQLAAVLRENGLAPLEDPTNRELAVPRNRLRHRVLPHLAGEDPELPRRLAELAARVRSARAVLDRRLEEALEMRADPRREGIAVRRAGFLRLPAELRPLALAALHRRAGAEYPAGRPARAELMRQLADPNPRRRVGCDCGGGWRWQQERGGWLALRRAPPVSLILFPDPGREPSPRIARSSPCDAGGDEVKSQMSSPSPQPSIQPLYSAEELRESLGQLGSRLAASFGTEEPLLICILGGSLIFLADLVRAIDRPLRYELVQVGYSDHADPAPPATAEGGAVLDIRYPFPVEIEGQEILVVKDVVSSGVIEAYLEQQLREKGARAVRFVALLDLPDERKTAFAVADRAFTTERQGIFVGYGLKHEGRFGHLPYIGRLAET